MNKTVEVVNGDGKVINTFNRDELPIISGGKRFTIRPTDYGFDLIPCDDLGDPNFEEKTVYSLLNGRRQTVIDGIFYRIKKP